MKDSVQRVMEAEAESYRRDVLAPGLESRFRTLAGGLLESPDKLKVRFEWAADAVLVRVRPAPEDAAKLIGGKGRMYHSFKVLLEHYCAKQGLELRYRVENDHQTLPARNIVFQPRSPWPAAEVDQIFSGHCLALFGPGFNLRREDERWKPKSKYYLDLPADEPDWSPELQLSLSFLWHATAYRMGRLVYLESVGRRA